MRVEIVKGGAGLLADRAAVWVAERKHPSSMHL